MTKEEMRLECLKLASDCMPYPYKDPKPMEVTISDIAEVFYKYITKKEN